VTDVDAFGGAMREGREHASALNEGGRQGGALNRNSVVNVRNRIDGLSPKQTLKTASMDVASPIPGCPLNPKLKPQSQKDQQLRELPAEMGLEMGGELSVVRAGEMNWRGSGWLRDPVAEPRLVHPAPLGGRVACTWASCRATVGDGQVGETPGPGMRISCGGYEKFLYRTVMEQRAH
jgi:hypothetical protein